MGILFRNSQGIETPLAGLAPAGQLVPSVSLYQKGSITNTTSIASKDYVRIEITLNTPMPDTDYVVDLQTMQGHGLANAFCDAYGKTNSGFAIILANPSDNNVPANQIQVVWRAFKLMTDEDRALDEAKIEQNTKNFANEFSAISSYAVGDYCTYQGVLYRCTVQHTASAWNSSHFTATSVSQEADKTLILARGTTGWLSNDGISFVCELYAVKRLTCAIYTPISFSLYDVYVCPYNQSYGKITLIGGVDVNLTLSQSYDGSVLTLIPSISYSGQSISSVRWTS
jgi:hypothetical protein